VSEAGLVVRQGSLAELEEALAAASGAIADAVTTAMADVDREVRGWSATTASRAAQLDHQRRLCDGVERLTAALDQVRTAVAEHREEARRIEVRNVALMES
jgi:hypothetical protein